MGKRKARIYGQEEEAEEAGESFNDLVKRAKTDPSAATASDISKRRGVLDKGDQEAKPAKPQVEARKTPLTKDEKAALKGKRKAAKKLLSFED